MRRWARISAAFLFACSAGGTPSPLAAGSVVTPRMQCVSVDEGLPSPTVEALARDGDGALWIATSEGLARYDGVEIRGYGRREGLTPPYLWDVATDEAGRIWLASHGRGLLLLLDRASPVPIAATGQQLDTADGPSRFASWDAGVRGSLARIEPRIGGGVWLLDRGHLIEGVPSDSGLELRAVTVGEPVLLFHAAAAERRPWIVRASGGRLGLERGEERCAFPAQIVADGVELGSDEEGRLFVASPTAVFRSRNPPGSDCGKLEWEALPLPLPAGEEIRSVTPRRRGGLWVGTSRGLWRTDTGLARRFEAANGAPRDEILALLDDPRAGLFLGTLTNGLCRLPVEGLAGLSPGEGLANPVFERLVEGHRGNLYAISESGWFELLGDRLVLVPGSESEPWRRAGGRVVADSSGFWVGTSAGLARIEGARLDPRRALWLGRESGLPAAEIFGGRPQAGLWSDSDGTVWVALTGAGLYVRHFGSSVFVQVPDPSGVWREAPPLAFARDSAGDLWIGDFLGLRLLDGSALATLALPGGSDARALFRDRAGVLWIGRRYGGLARVVARHRTQVQIDSWTTRDGLLSDAVASIAEDRAGRLWLCTGRGLNRFDPASGGIEAWTVADGVPAGPLHHCYVDSAGVLWIAGRGGLARLDPSGIAVPPAPEVRLREVVAGGEPLALDERGERSHSGLRLGPGPAPLFLRVAGTPFTRGLRFRFRLEPPTGAAWSEPSPESSVRYSGLGPGRYRLSAQALDAAGRSSSQSAALDFEVVAPFWRRPVVVAAAILLFLTALLLAHRGRLARERALSGVREQLAADLHDDLGAGLARIAMMAELARREPAPTAATAVAGERLARIAEGARELVESMSDVVWALRPERDTGQALVQRLRRFASDMLAVPGLELSFVAELPDDLPLDAGQRRDLLLAGKELVTNVARHSGAASVEVVLRQLEGRVVLEVRDDGVGFQVSPGDGQGLTSLARRAERSGGRFRVAARPGGGTEASFELPSGGGKRHYHDQVGR